MPSARGVIEIASRWVVTLMPAVLLVLLAWPGLARVSEGGQQKNVLVIYDERDKLPGLAILDQSLRATFGSSSSFKIDIYSEGLDRSRFAGEDHDRVLADFFREKYRDKRIDVILAVKGPSLDFLLAHGQEIAPGSPIVFCGIDRRELEGRDLNPNVTGVLLRREFKGTLNVALQLQPDTRQVVFIAGTSDFDRRLVEQAKTDLSSYENRLAIRYLTNNSLDDILNQVAQLSPNTIVLVTTMFNDADGRVFIPHDVVSLISQKANMPVYGFNDQYLGLGIVGGYLDHTEEQGKKAAELAISILEGRKPADIPIVEAEVSSNMFDWREMQRWGISDGNVPAGSIIRFKELTVWQQYKWHIAAVLIFSVVQTFLIGWLFFANSRRRMFSKKLEEREAQLSESLHQLQLAAAAANVGMFTRKVGGDILWISEKAAEILGFPKGKQVTREDYLQNLHPDDRPALLNVISKMDEGISEFQHEYRVITKDKGIRWVHSRGRIDDVDGGRLVRGALVDITRLKMAEEAIRVLSGKLMAAQEKERVRLANELHNGLNQNMALLAIELATLRNQPKDIAYVRERLDHFASEMETLSSDIHRISQELHPAKLTELGLEAALRGFCRALVVEHSLEIEFQAKDLPRHLPQDLSICVYRVTQELLHNVIEHSGATMVHVSLKADDVGLRLTVLDNGRGFDHNSAMEKDALGLIGIDERVRRLKGMLEIISAADEGARVSVHVPWPQDDVEYTVDLTKFGFSRDIDDEDGQTPIS